MRVDLTAAPTLRVAGRDVAEVRIAGRLVWPRPDPLVTRIAGVGYAGSTYQVAYAGAGRWQYDIGGGWAEFAPAQTSDALTTGLVQDGAAISWLREDGVRSNITPRLATPYSMSGVIGVFDIRRVAPGATSWAAVSGGMSYTQPNAAIRPVYEAAGLSGKPCVFSDWNRNWILNGLTPAPGARTLMGVFSLGNTDPNNWFTLLYPPVVGGWSLMKSYPTGGKRALAITRRGSEFTQIHQSNTILEDNIPFILSAKTKRPSGEYGFRHNGAPAGSGTQPMTAYAEGAGDYTVGGYIRQGSHAYVDDFVSDAEIIKFEGWSAWTQGFVDLLPPGHPNKIAPPLAA